MPNKHQAPKPKAKGSQTLFGIMRMLTAEQRQKLGAQRRALKADPKVKEEIVEDKKAKAWVLRYKKGKKKIAEARLKHQELELKEF